MKKPMILGSVLIAYVLSVSIGGHQVASMQEKFSGNWTAKVKDTEKGQMLWLNLTMDRDKDGRKSYSNWGFTLPLQDFSGLNPNANSQTQFTLNREAGTVLFDGLFKDGKGVGDFRFTPNTSFISTLRGLGYDDVPSDKLFSMTIHDVGTRFIGEMKALGYDKLPIDKLISFRIFNVNEEFIRKMQSLGYDKIPADKLVALRIHNVTEEFIREFQALGYNKLPLDKLIAMKIHGVSTSFVKEMSDLGYREIPVDKLIAFRIHGVSSEFVREMGETGFSNI